MRRAYRAGRQNHLAATTCTAQLAVLTPAYAVRALAAQFQPLHKTASFKLQVFPVQYRLEKSARRRPAAATFLVDVKIGNAFVVAGIEVLNCRNAILICRRAK